MDWIQVVSVLGTVIGSVASAAAYLHVQIKNDMKEIRQALTTQGARTDKLYEMFVDLIKEGRK